MAGMLRQGFESAAGQPRYDNPDIGQVDKTKVQDDKNNENKEADNDEQGETVARYVDQRFGDSVKLLQV